MQPTRLFAAALLLTGTSLAFAAPAPYLTLDHSSGSLMDQATARALWQEHLPAKLVKLYPIKKWGFVSEVEGGFDDAKVCVVTARAMMLPRSGKTLVFQPKHTATAFGSKAGATETQCKALAKVKLHEAMLAVGSALLAQ
jgi:hypothetical protein